MMNADQSKNMKRFAGTIVLVAVFIVALTTQGRWWPGVKAWVQDTISSRRAAESELSHGHSHGGSAHSDDDHGHDHAGHDDASSLELSTQALQNLGLVGDGIGRIEIGAFERSFSVPAVVVERPGKSRTQISTPMTGLVTAIHAVPGEAIDPGTLLFELKLTHEDLVKAQTDFVRMLGELDIEEREIERLESVASSGSVARKTLIEREYARDKLKSYLIVQREALRLHGLTEQQVHAIETQRRLLTDLKLYSPSEDGTSRSELNLSDQRGRDTMFPVAFLSTEAAPPMILRELHVHRGQAVNAGEPLATLVDYSQLYVEGMAFEQDIVALTQAIQNGWTVRAEFDETAGRRHVVADLEIAYVDSEVDSASRTMKFYVRLPNELLPSPGRQQDTRFINWRYRPGQRLQLQIPAEVWEKQIVLPVDAVASEGAEYFVFQQNGNHFDRVPVHVKYRDQTSVVIANDGQLFPGDTVAMKAAHQMQMALKNKSGGAVDPHAGHNH